MAYLKLARMEMARQSGLFRFASFVACGGLSVIASLATLWFFTGVVSIHYALSNLLAFVASTLVWFYTNKHVTFRDSMEQGHSLIRSIMIRVVGLLANEGILVFLVAIGGLNYMIAAIIATALLFPITYWLSTILVWQTRISYGEGN